MHTKFLPVNPNERNHFKKAHENEGTKPGVRGRSAGVG